MRFERRWAAGERPERARNPGLPIRRQAADTRTDLTLRACPAEQAAVGSPRRRLARPDRMIGITDSAISVVNRL